MARRKRRVKRKQRMFNVDTAVIGLMAASILMAVLIYGESGYVGKMLSGILGGLFGSVKNIIPIGMFLVSIYTAYDDKSYVSSKMFKFVIVLCCLSTILSIYQISLGNININQPVAEVCNKAYYMGTNNMSGGVLGTLISIPLEKLLGQVGTVIFAFGISAIFIVCIFGIKPSDYIVNMLETMAERREERKNFKSKVEVKETKKEQRLREKLERERERQKAILDVEQVKINLNEENVTGKKKDKDSNVSVESSLFKEVEDVKEDKKKEVLQLAHAITVEDENYEYPPITLLSKASKRNTKGNTKSLTETAAKLQKTLYSFGVSAKVENISVGPAITRYELKPAEGVRVSKIANLSDDIALNLAAETIRIEAPIPGKQAVGIEIPNKEKEMVHLREIIESDEFLNSKSKLTVALGKDVSGKIMITDISKMPHVLVAGATGSGKSVCINTLITSIIYNAKPSEVKLVMIDPKMVELSTYNGIPHLLIPVVTDPRKAAGALAWAVQEMENRYTVFAAKGVKDLKSYNESIEKENEIGKLPQIVVIIDELADLMMVAAKEVEDSICRLAQKARAAGMHLVIATQRPSVDVITGLIKANIPSRIAFAVSSQVDSRTILDGVGAEKLLGKGDMLFDLAGSPKLVRIQGAFVTDEEVQNIVGFVKSNGEAKYSEDILESIEHNNSTDKEIMEQNEEDDVDPFLMEAIDIVVETGQASTSFIQRRFKVGYARAGRIIDQMEERGIISGYQGSKPRQVLVSPERLQELKMQTSDADE